MDGLPLEPTRSTKMRRCLQEPPWFTKMRGPFESNGRVSPVRTVQIGWTEMRSWSRRRPNKTVQIEWTVRRGSLRRSRLLTWNRRVSVGELPNRMDVSRWWASNSNRLVYVVGEVRPNRMDGNVGEDSPNRIDGSLTRASFKSNGQVCFFASTVPVSSKLPLAARDI